MNGSCLLDTNIIIALFDNDSDVISRLTGAGAVYASVITIGELYYGALKSGRVQGNLTRVMQLAQSIGVLNSDSDTARLYGQVKNQLRQKGKPIPENDIWIAAVAIQYDLPLVSRDGHFQAIEDLRIEVW